MFKHFILSPCLLLIWVANSALSAYFSEGLNLQRDSECNVEKDPFCIENAKAISKRRAEDESLCPDLKDPKRNLHRLGNTRFFIIDHKGSTDMSLNVAWEEANSKCQEFSPDMRMATFLNKVTTNAIIARNLEILATNLNLKETVYWIDAMFDKEGDNDLYKWKSNKRLDDVIQYSNFHYQQPRPTGIGGHFGSSNTEDIFGPNETYSRQSEVAQCLAFALPYVPSDSHSTLGWQASWVERACIGKTHRRVLCESTNDNCEENHSRNPHVLTEDKQKEDYYTEGNWIFANRRFIVNWKPVSKKILIYATLPKRTKAEADKYCEDREMQVYSPLPEDDCLIPYLKLWTPVISTYHFWTSYNFDSTKKEFYDRDGNVLEKITDEKVKYKYRTNKKDDQFCVSYMWTYEFKNETRCKGIKCDWMYYLLAPANCNNPVGTICQHKIDDNTRMCNFKKEWLIDHEQAIEDTAVVEFGYKGSGFWRSTYKQTFGSRICGHPDRQMIDDTVEYWKVDGSGVEFIYDYEGTYWVVDEHLFENVGKDEELCTISVGKVDTDDFGGSTFRRELGKENCNAWHFYLCESVV